MSSSDPAIRYKRHHAVRLLLLVVGWLLIAATPFVGVIPGPGGVFVFAAGAALVLKNSYWAKRRYVRFERRWPKQARWSNWALRRTSPRHKAEAPRRGGKEEVAGALPAGDGGSGVGAPAHGCDMGAAAVGDGGAIDCGGRSHH